MKQMKRFMLGMTIGLLLLGSMGCGGSDGDNDATTPSGTSATTSTPKDTTGVICDHDAYNCADGNFDVVFPYCKAQGAGDIHRLDWNKNDIPCEEPDRGYESESITIPTPTPIPMTPAATPAPSTGSAAACTGCCSSHGGVVCSGGITKCADGSDLSATCSSKGCNKC